MSSTDDKMSQWRLRSSYVTTIVSISLVMFMLGVMGLLLLNANRISSYVKENIGFTIVLKDNVKEIDSKRLQKELDLKPYVKSTEFITREQAAQELSSQLGEDFVQFLGYNPLFEAIDVKFYANYTNMDSIPYIEQSLLTYPEVKEILYQKSLVHTVNENVRKIGFILFVLSAVLFLISVALINNTIRLSIYSKRFLINTMKLVGATENFIIKPFLLRGALHGAMGGVLSIVLLAILNWLTMSDFEGILSINSIIILYVIILFVGAFISTLSTYLAVNKFLKMKPDELHLN